MESVGCQYSTTQCGERPTVMCSITFPTLQSSSHKRMMEMRREREDLVSSVSCNWYYPYTTHQLGLMIRGVWGTPLKCLSSSPGSEVSLQPFRTDMTLCVPNPSFNHETRHTLVLPLAHPVQRAVMMACGSSGAIPFELWRRFYYPNIRDQLIAKVQYTITYT